ncbi:serine/threonine-protein kinase Nek9-like isoform X2 [Amphiura filiformis]|uniref:serine/threonine-protein kinase Nek9-like isoform X2 n=1 Tax=Amphiura filiformis TaxID=82378 RepID=UPI003B20B6FB
MATDESGYVPLRSSTSGIGGGDMQEEMYTPVRTLGKGAFGEAVLYRKTEDNSLVVWKEVDLTRCSDKAKRDTQNEIDILSLLAHANIIMYYNHFVDEQSLFIEMEYANGGTLYEKIVQQNDNLFGEEIVIWYFFQIASAIAHIHGQGILHRDIKTLNIFLTKSGLIKLGDFGISKQVGADAMAETVVGTPYYMSPELVRGQAYNTKSDMWSVGCVLFEILTLKRSFDASNPLKLVWGIVQKEIEMDDIDNSYSEAIKRMVKELLSKNPEKRPSAEEIVSSPIISNMKDDLLKKIWELNSATRKAVRQISNTTMDTIPIVTNKTSEVYYWGGGRLTPHKLDVFQKENTALQVAAGNMHFAAVTVEKELVTWANVHGGQDLVGQLGHGDTACYKTPRKVEKLVEIPIKAVSCGEDFTACITDDGELYAFGSDYYGCIGIDQEEGEEVLEPVLVEFFNNKPILQISCGDNHIVALTQDREVFIWGCGEFGRLGLGDEDDHFTPEKVKFRGNKTISSVCAGCEGTFFLTADGKVLACGSNEHNQLGFNTITAGLRKRQVKECYDIPYKDVPTLVKPLSRYNITSIAAGKTHSAAITDHGRLITFGQNKYGQLGVGDLKSRSGVNEVKGGLHGKIVVRADCGDSFTVIATSDNQIYSFGHSELGKLGISSEHRSSLKRKAAVPTPRPIFGALHMVSDLCCHNWNTIIVVEKVLKSKAIRSPRVDGLSTGKSSIVSSQDSRDDVFDSNSEYMSSEQSATPSDPPSSASLEPVVEPQQQQTKETDVDASDEDESADGQLGMGESSVPPWLQAELDDEFIPMGSYVQPDIPDASSNQPQPHPPAVSIPAKSSLEEPAPNRTKDSSHNGTSHPSGGSSGYNSIAIKVPPLNLDGLSASGAAVSLRSQMGNARDDEIEELNDRIQDLEKENHQLKARVEEQDARIKLLENKVCQMEQV